jgi:hypothetical protein
MMTSAKLAATLLSALLLAANAYSRSSEIAPPQEEEDSQLHVWVFLEDDPNRLERGGSTHIATERALDRRSRRGSLSLEQYQRLDRHPDKDNLSIIHKTGAEIRHVSRWLHAVSIKATSGQIEAIAGLPFVKGMEPVRGIRRFPIPEENRVARSRGSFLSKAESLDYGPSFGQLEMLNVPAVHQQGYSGRGVLVLVLDAGFYKEHEAIHQNRIVGEYDFVSNDTNTQNETVKEDSLGHHIHGTQVYSVLGGYSPGKLIGAAYECSFLLAKTEIAEYDTIIEEDNFVAALEWGESRGADIVSSSVGYLDWYQPDALDGNTAITTRAVRWATRTGMVVVIAAGNERQNTSWGGNIVVPADADSIISVGAVAPNGSIANFSSHGPTYDGRIKPELVAQGMLVTCAAAWDSAAYTVSNGSSYSAPLIAGSAALLLEAHPNWGPMDVRDALLATASYANKPDNDYGWGIPDVLAALSHDLAALGHDGGRLEEEQMPRLTHLYPNPLSRGGRFAHLTIRWEGPRTAPVSLDIYSVLGQHILGLYSPHEKALGLGTVTWDGQDARGKSLPSGIYMLRLTTGSKSITKRVTLLR